MTNRGTASLFCLALATSGAPGLTAQTVQGTVSFVESGAPVNGAFVRVLDNEGRQLAGALTDAFGHYRLVVPDVGSYFLRAEFIGRHPAQAGPLPLAREDVLEWSPSLSARPIALTGLEVSGSARCQVRPEEGTLAARLWDEARQALEVAVWAEDQRLFQYHLFTYRRELEPDRGRIVAEEGRRREGFFRQPFKSLPAADLVLGGFVQETPNGSLAFAPDARVLLSAEFLDSHCFGARHGEDGRIGLAFEPTQQRRVTDIRGVLWLDPESVELRSVTYRYVRFPGVAASLELGGEVGFTRLPTGAWIVRQWSLEMPVLADVLRRGTTDVYDRRVVGIMEEGGDVLRVVDEEGRTVLAADRATLAGTVFDSIRGRPLAGADVRLAGTDYRTVSNPEGTFLIADLPAGRYSVDLSHPRLDSLGMVFPTVPADLRVGATTWVALGVPTVSEVGEGLGPFVRGEVLYAGTEGPVVAALVTLIDEQGRPRFTEMTDRWGVYEMTAPEPGRYRVRVELVGHQAFVSVPFELADETRKFQSSAFDGPPVLLLDEPVTVPTPCVVRSTDGSATERTWEEVRKALRTLTWAQDAERFEYQIELHGPDPNDSEIVPGFVNHTFGQIPMDVAGRPDFVSVSASGAVAMVPGPRFFLSPWFAEHYCLGLVPSPGGAGTIAVSFEPSATPSATDVTGVILLDEVSGALQSIHYRYINYPEPSGSDAPGGWMTFSRLSQGAFFVRAWEERLPGTAWIRAPATNTPACPVPASQVFQGGSVRQAHGVPDAEDVWRPPDAEDRIELTSERMWSLGRALDERVTERSHRGDFTAMRGPLSGEEGEAEGDVHVIGVVRALEGLAPIREALVRIVTSTGPVAVVTNEFGRFEMRELPAGQSAISVSVPWRRAMTGTLRAEQPGTYEVCLLLSSTPGDAPGP